MPPGARRSEQRPTRTLLPAKGVDMKAGSVASHTAVGAASALLGACATCAFLTGWPSVTPRAHAQGQPGVRQIDLFQTVMKDVMGREVTIRRTERDPGNASGPHRHPGSHTFGYVLE